MLNAVAKLFRPDFDRAAFRRSSRSRRMTPRSRKLMFEPLESRTLLSVGLIGVPSWTPEGPAPQISAGNVIAATPADQQDVGAINAIAVDPANNKHVFVGTVNGGIWQTSDITAASPVWTTTTDRLPSLSIGAIAISPTNSNVIYAGTGQFSSNFAGGNAVGVYKSVDGGQSWTILNPSDANSPNGIFTGLRINRIVPTTLNGGQTVFLSTVDTSFDSFGNPTGGIYRSDDGGNTWTRLSGANGLPNGGVTDLVENPNNANQFYAGIPGSGVWALDLGNGTAWTNVSNNISNTDLGAALRIELAISPAGANPIWVSIINTTGFYQRVYRGIAGGGTVNWTAVGDLVNGVNQPPDILSGNHQGGTHGAIEADPNSDTLVYLSGDATNQGARAGYVVRGDSTVNTNTWTALTPIGQPGDAGTVVPKSNGDTTAPHADSRDMAFGPGGVLLMACDGGCYIGTNPSSTTNGAQVWSSANGSLQISEMYNVSYDSVFNVILGGDQDTGNPSQTAPGSFTYTDNSGGDGGATAVDGFTGNISNRYFFGAVRKQYSGPNTRVAGDNDASIYPQAGIAGFGNFLGSVVNAIAPTSAQLGAGQSTRVVIAGSGGVVYESNDAGSAALTQINGRYYVQDTWTQVPTGAGFVQVNQVNANASNDAVMAYGGRSGGVDNPDVLYVASGSSIFLRSAANGTLTATAKQPAGAGTITSIALDPNDWHTAFVTDNQRVYMTTDAGANWTNITGNLSNQGQRLANLEGAKLAVVAGAGGVNALLFSGSNGISRMLTNNPGAWSTFGAGLPNTLVGGMQYDPTDDVLVAGLFGRGAWEIANASTTVFSTGELQITGDTDFANEDDTIKLVIDQNNPLLLDVFLNSSLFQCQLSTVQQIDVSGLGGNDTLIVDCSNGLVNVANGIRYDGGTGSDALQLVQTGGPTRASDTYSVGPNNGQGVSTIVGGGNAGTQTVSFQNLEPVLDLVPATTLTVNATNGDNAISYTGGSLVTRGKVSVDAQESIEFAGKTNLVINSLAGSDAISINNAQTPTGLAKITVNGGDPGAGDALTIAGAGAAAVSVDTGAAAITGATGAGGAVSIAYSGIESLALTSGVKDLSLTTTGADDALTVTPGATGTNNSGTLTSNGAVPSISFVNSGSVTADLKGGNDTVTVNGTANADTIAVSGTGVSITGLNAVNYSNVEAVNVNGLAGADTFNVTPSAVAVSIDGGDPIGTLPGDLLNIAAGGQSVTYNAGPTTDAGSFGVGSNAPVNFTHIESFGISGSGPATINGTNGPDAITVIARDSSFSGLADGEQDFTVSVNSGPQLLFLNVGSLAVNALGGSDQVTLIAPAPNNAVWNVNVTIDGGPPSAGTADQLVVQTPGGASETASYTPTSANSGTLNLTSITSTVALADIESLVYDGQNDNDSLTVVGTTGADTIVHTPGANDQAGTFAVNALLPISYQNLGAAAVLTVNGNGGADTLVVNGSTSANNSFSVDAAGKISLNTRLPIATANIATLTLQGGAGDDSFTLQPAISASVYTTMNVNGGGQASSTGDRVFLLGTTGNDTITVSGQTVSLGGKTVVGSGIEDIRINGAGGTDGIVYNGVAGVTEHITVSSSGVVGGGQISVTGVTLVDFSGVGAITVNGNTPTPTETDTVAFSGTNAADYFNINLAAAGTTADPVLRLLSSSSSTPPLLTLVNYTNFSQLGINGLDGADTFNVYTADSTTIKARTILIDGGPPTAKKKATDELNVYYAGNRPRIIQSAATQNPGTGLVDLTYPNSHYLVQYTDIEDIVIAKGTAP